MELHRLPQQLILDSSLTSTVTESMPAELSALIEKTFALVLGKAIIQQGRDYDLMIALRRAIIMGNPGYFLRSREEWREYIALLVADTTYFTVARSFIALLTLRADRRTVWNEHLDGLLKVCLSVRPRLDTIWTAAQKLEPTLIALEPCPQMGHLYGETRKFLRGGEYTRQDLEMMLALFPTSAEQLLLWREVNNARGEQLTAEEMRSLREDIVGERFVREHERYFHSPESAPGTAEDQSELTQRLADAQARVRALEEQQAALLAEKDKLEARIAALQSECSQLQAQLAAQPAAPQDAPCLSMDPNYLIQKVEDLEVCDQTALDVKEMMEEYYEDREGADALMRKIHAITRTRKNRQKKLREEQERRAQTPSIQMGAGSTMQFNAQDGYQNFDPAQKQISGNTTKPLTDNRKHE